MHPIPQTPTRTPLAARWLESSDAQGDRIKRALLANIDGHRNVIELESFARAMGLAPDALQRLRDQRLIRMAD
jgi:hypothetical protein